MDGAHPIVDNTHFSQCSLLNQLAPALLDELLNRSRIKRLPPGRRLFHCDDPDTRALFFLSGQLALVSKDHATRMVRAGSREACAPIDPHALRLVTVLARSCVTILSIDSELHAEPLYCGRKTPVSEHANERAFAAADTTGDQLFASPLLSPLPQAHPQALKNRATFLHRTAGAMLLRESDPSPYYCLIEQSRFRLNRCSRPRGQEMILMEASPGDVIGETVLITAGRCGITATAAVESRGTRFSKGEFPTLPLRPHIKSITYTHVLHRQPASTVLLDVLPFRALFRNRLPRGVNSPLKLLRQTTRLLDWNHDYIVYADKLVRSMTAAILLACQRIESSLLCDAASVEHRGNPGAGMRGFTPLHA
jgi:CRP-like cAMP-binding protein